MKILIVSQHYFPDPFSITTIAEYLVKKGHDVTVLTGKPNYGYYRIVPGYEHLDYEILNGVKIYRVNVIPRKGTKMSIVKNYLSFWKRTSISTKESIPSIFPSLHNCHMVYFSLLVLFVV